MILLFIRIGSEAHPQALIVLLLAGVFDFNWNLGAWGMRLRYVIAFLALFWCSVPVALSPVPDDSDMAMTLTLVAWLVAIVAIVARWRSLTASSAASPAVR